MVQQNKISIFIAYAHTDEAYLKLLRKHLSLLEDDAVSIWYDGEILPGQEWDHEIKTRLHSADIILLLVSIDFLTSDYVRGTELPAALNRHGSGQSIVVPVIVRSCGWTQKLGTLQALPKDGFPVENWSSKDSAFHNVFEGVERIISTMNKPQAQTTLPKPIIHGINIDPFKDSMILLDGGQFEMGIFQKYQYVDARPPHPVKIAPFHLCKSLVTREQFYAIIGKKSVIKKKNEPISRVSREEVDAFLDALNGQFGRRYRLPSEAEWEFAARGGKTRKKFEYSGSDNIDEVAWYRKNTKEAMPVMQKKANSAGIFDMSGNVWEMCEDLWHENYEKAPTDGKPWLLDGHNKYRVVRGGSFEDNDIACKVFVRGSTTPKHKSSVLGFRLAHDYPM